MKTNLLLCFVLLFVAGCSQSRQINGHTITTANKSVKQIKEHLPDDAKLEYELSYWIIRDEFKNDDQFLRTIDGKDPLELIRLGQDSFNRRKAAGMKDYLAFADWQSMLNDYSSKRANQSKPSVNAEKDANYKRSVIYNPRFRT
mgnify:CR=1 FL=1|jgi:hypothetical protein